MRAMEVFKGKNDASLPNGVATTWHGPSQNQYSEEVRFEPHLHPERLSMQYYMHLNLLRDLKAASHAYGTLSFWLLLSHFMLIISLDIDLKLL